MADASPVATDTNTNEKHDPNPTIADAIKAFERASTEWRTHAVADDGAYEFSPGDHVRFSGLQSADGSALNGTVGVVLAYVPTKGRFSVCLENRKPAAVKAANLCVEPRADASGPRSEVKAIEALFFAPGMHYEGTIQIPGDAGLSAEQLKTVDNNYELTVAALDPEEDDLGLELNESRNKQYYVDLQDLPIMARHKAYGDEQYFTITVLVGDGNSSEPATSSSEFSIEFADGETRCKGRWVPSAQQFQGSVRQKYNAVDEIFHKIEPETHTFTLAPTGGAAASETFLGPALQQKARHRAATECSLRCCLAAFAALASKVRPPELAALQLLRDAPWATLLQGAARETERACGVFRRQAAVLDALQFDTPVARVATLAGLAARGLSLAAAHAAWDRVLRLVQRVWAAWAACDRAAACASRGETLFYTAQMRLETNYAKLESALRRAEQRLTADTLTQFERPPPTAADGAPGGGEEEVSSLEGDTTCAICFVPLAEGPDGSAPTQPPLFLPCKHTFHGACIREWLHNHARCPMCRADLSPDARVGAGS
jgi:hypothetical protein